MVLKTNNEVKSMLYVFEIHWLQYLACNWFKASWIKIVNEFVFICYLSHSSFSYLYLREEPDLEPIHSFPISTHPSDVLDMPVDPNEPTYCLCNQVSYGEMIGCDNPDVSITRASVTASGLASQSNNSTQCNCALIKRELLLGSPNRQLTAL